MKEKTARQVKKLSAKELEELIIDLAKQGLTSEKIGLKLREKNANVKELEMKISEILKKHNLYKDSDIENLTKIVERLKKHLAKNKHDYTTKRILSIKGAKLRKLKKYRG